MTSHLQLLLGCVFLTSCFPSTYLERPEIEVRVVDSKSSKRIEDARVTYRNLDSRLGENEQDQSPKFETYTAKQGEVTIQERTSFGIFWLMQQPIPLAYSLTAEAPGYLPSSIQRKQFTHGPFRSDQEVYGYETIRLNRR